MPRTAPQVVQEEFLLARAKIIELAATLDRIDRASSENSASSLRQESPQLRLLLEGISILLETEPHRAQRVQELMSRPYDPTWRQQWTI